MDIIEKCVTESEFCSRAFDTYFGGMRMATFDIETTGFSSAYCRMVLAGFAYHDGDKLKSVQIFCESDDDEALVLEETLRMFAQFDFIVTYNGASFDMPFFIERLRRNNMKIPGLPFDFDLLPVVRKFSDIKSFTPNLKQKSVENFMGLWGKRTDRIDGGNSVELYYDYLVSRDDDLKETILLHNHDDVLQLYRLLGVLSRCDIHAAMNHLGFPVKTEAGTFVIDKVNITRNSLTISGTQSHENSFAYVDPGMGDISCSFSQNGSFSIEIMLQKHSDMFLADLVALGIDAHDHAIDELPTYGSDYLIVKHGKQLCHQECNLLAKSVLECVTKKIMYE